MSDGVYAADKAAAWPDRIAALQAGKQPAPVHLHMILSDLCSLDCPGCAYRMSGYSSNQRFGIWQDGKVNNNPNRMLHLNLVLDVLRDFADMGGKSVEFTGGGEPTLHPHLNGIINFAQTLGLDTALITHGLDLHKKLDPKLLVKLAWLRISIDAATPETYGKVRPSVGGPRGENFYNALASVYKARKLIEAAKSDCQLGTGFVVQKENWREVLAASLLYRQAGAHNMRISGLFTPEKDAYFGDWRGEAEQHERMAVGMADLEPGFKVYGRLSEKISDLTAPPDYAFCGYQNFTTYMGGDGNLYRCCVTSYNDQGLIGNVEAAGGFRALWESDQKKQRFDGFDARSCSQCQFNLINKSILSLVRLGVPDGRTPRPHDSFV